MTTEERAIISQEQELAKIRTRAANRAMDKDREVEVDAIGDDLNRLVGAEEVGGLLDPAGNDLDQPPLRGERPFNDQRPMEQANVIDRQAELLQEQIENRAKFDAEEKKKRSDAAKKGWEKRQELDRLVEEEDQRRNSSWSSGQSITLTDSQQIDLARNSSQQPFTNNGFQPLPPVTPEPTPPTINRNTTMPDSSTDSSIGRDNVLDDYFRSSTDPNTGVITFPTIQAFDQNTVQPSADPNELSRSEAAARNAANDAAHAAELAKYQPSVGQYPEPTQSNDDLMAQLDEENAATQPQTTDELGRDWEHIDGDAGSYVDSVDWSAASDARDLNTGELAVEPPNPRFTDETDKLTSIGEEPGEDTDDVLLGSPTVSPRNTVMRGVNSQPQGAVQPEFVLPPNRATPIGDDNLGAGNIFSSAQSRQRDRDEAAMNYPTGAAAARAAALARNEAMMM
jgi:hypothetical protein